MGKPKLRPLPAILKLVESLSEDERADLRDYLRPAPKSRQKGKGGSKSAQKRKVGKEATGAMPSPDTECGQCDHVFSHNVHHLPSTVGYHEFVEPAGEAKGASV